MEVLRARVCWMEEYGNTPNLELLVDALPERGMLRFQYKDTHWYADYEGYVEFYSWDPVVGGNQGGFGRRVFPITTVDGEKVDLKGPWSSRSGLVHKLGFGPCLDLSFTDDPAVWERGYTLYFGHVALASLEGVEIEGDPSPVLRLLDMYGERWWVPVIRGEHCQRCGKESLKPMREHGSQKGETDWRVCLETECRWSSLG